MKAILTLHRANQIAAAEVVSATGMTATQALILSAVADSDKPSQTDICEVTSVDRSTLAECVNRLTKAGYLARKRSKADARRYELTLTAKGTSALKKINGSQDQITAALAARVSGLDGLSIMEQAT